MQFKPWVRLVTKHVRLPSTSQYKFRRTFIFFCATCCVPRGRAEYIATAQLLEQPIWPPLLRPGAPTSLSPGSLVQSQVGPVPWCQAHFRSNTTPAHHVTNICCSVALYFLLWTVADCCREPLLAHACREWLKHASMRASEVLKGAVPLCDRAEVLPGGRVGGHFRAMHVRQAVVFQEYWQRLYVEAALREPFEQDSHSVLDVLCFGLRFERDRRKSRRPPRWRYGAAFTRFLSAMAGALIGHVLFDRVSTSS